MLPDFQEKQRLEHVMNAAIKTYVRTQREQADKSVEIAKEHTAYFEKIALGAGAVMAAIVSFVGSKKDLNPSWLLRATLISLAVSIITVLIRNAVYPYYVGNMYLRRTLMAEMEERAAKAEYAVRYPSLDIETGHQVDGAAYMDQYRKMRVTGDAELNESTVQRSAASSG